MHTHTRIYLLSKWCTFKRCMKFSHFVSKQYNQCNLLHLIQSKMYPVQHMDKPLPKIHKKQDMTTVKTRTVVFLHYCFLFSFPLLKVKTAITSVCSLIQMTPFFNPNVRHHCIFLSTFLNKKGNYTILVNCTEIW